MKTYLSLLLVIVLILVSQTILAQNISGKIVDEKGDVIPGVNIIIKGTPNGTVTNYGGEFEIQVPEGKAILYFAFIGYKAFEMEVVVDKDGNYTLNATLVKDKLTNKKLESSGKLTGIKRV